MALVRGSPDVAGRMVICVEGGTTVIYTDKHGVPTAAPHFCPECSLVGLAGPAGPSGKISEDLGRETRAAVLPGLLLPTASRIRPEPRAPPYFL